MGGGGGVWSGKWPGPVPSTFEDSDMTRTLRPVCGLRCSSISSPAKPGKAPPKRQGRS